MAKDQRRASAAPVIPLTFTEKMTAGAIARGVAQTILHPVDVIRTRVQARGVATSWNPKIFVKGVIPQISLAIPAGAVQFLAFEAAKERLATLLPDEKFSQARILVAGALGALTAASFRVPQEVLKQRIQADIYPNIYVALRETVGTSGLPSLYKGWLATISRDVPWNALSFMFHGQGKKIFASINGRPPKNDENLAVAGVAGAIAAIIMTPVDVVKTRIMTQRAGAAQYSGILNTLKKIIAEEGAGTLMKGVLPRIVFLAPLAGITFSVYEAIAKNIRARKAAQATAYRPVSPDLSATVDGESSLRRHTLALRFAKNPVKLAANSAQFPSTLSDINLSSAPIFFSLPSC